MRMVKMAFNKSLAWIIKFITAITASRKCVEREIVRCFPLFYFVSLINKNLTTLLISIEHQQLVLKEDASNEEPQKI
jgi:hypothetical protein